MVRGEVIEDLIRACPSFVLPGVELEDLGVLEVVYELGEVSQDLFYVALEEIGVVIQEVFESLVFPAVRVPHLVDICPRLVSCQGLNENYPAD